MAGHGMERGQAWQGQAGQGMDQGAGCDVNKTHGTKNTMNEKNCGFGFGIPTAPDLKLLDQSFANLKDGDLASYQDIETALKIKRTTPRFRTVLNAWRNQLYREQNIFFVAEAGKGLRVGTPQDRVHTSCSRYKGGLRKIAKAGDVASCTSVVGLSPEELKAKDHVTNAAAMLKLAAATEAKKLRLPALK